MLLAELFYWNYSSVYTAYIVTLIWHLKSLITMLLGFYLTWNKELYVVLKVFSTNFPNQVLKVFNYI